MIDWAAWTPTIIVAGAALFNHGQLVGRIKNQEVTVKEHHDRLKEHDDSIDRLGNRMTAAEAWNEGYSAGANKGGSK